MSIEQAAKNLRPYLEKCFYNPISAIGISNNTIVVYYTRKIKKKLPLSEYEGYDVDWVNSGPMQLL